MLTVDAEAFNRGYRDCKASLSSTAATSLSAPTGYDPPQEFREAYDAGWRKAEEVVAASLQRSERRHDIIGNFVLGFLLAGGGVALTAFTITSGGGVVVIAYGAIIAGIGFLVRAFALLFKRKDPTDPDSSDDSST